MEKITKMILQLFDSLPADAKTAIREKILADENKKTEEAQTHKNEVEMILNSIAFEIPR